MDGFWPDFSLEEKWPAPNLKKMARDGVQALGVRGAFPSVTYPLHTTLVSGAMQTTNLEDVAPVVTRPLDLETEAKEGSFISRDINPTLSSSCL